ncbi:MAG: alpha/beta fold hydrolase [Steroidobacteraceae bacterium]
MPASSATPDLYLPVAEALLRYRDEGQGPAVLLIHGWTLDLDMWEPQVAALGDDFRFIRFDRRGFGLSFGRASRGADAQDALRLCDQLRIERFACVGMSQGARVALRLCRLVPARLSCVVLDGPPRTLAEECAEAGEDLPLSEYRSLMVRGDIESFRRLWAAHPLMQLETPSADAHALLARMTAGYDGRDLLPELPAPEADREPLIDSSLRTPALIMTGEHDLPARVRAADALASALPGARRAIINCARHLPNLDNPSAYNAALRGFLVRHAASIP